MNTTTEHAHPDDLWAMTYNGTDDTWVSSCRLCGWRGEPGKTHTAPMTELNAHLVSAEHRRVDEGRRGKAAGSDVEAGRHRTEDQPNTDR